MFRDNAAGRRKERCFAENRCIYCNRKKDIARIDKNLCSICASNENRKSRERRALVRAKRRLPPVVYPRVLKLTKSEQCLKCQHNKNNICMVYGYDILKVKDVCNQKI